MFTGLIETICTVKSVLRQSKTMQLTIDLGNITDGTKIGDSIAINGACLTVAKLDQNLAVFDVSGETLTKSTLGQLNTSSKVNAERAVKAADRLGGHIVQGHIDGVATIKEINKQDPFANIKFTTTPDLLGQMVAKGAVAVDGISLTIVNIENDWFSAAIIPETLKRTTLCSAKVGDAVNIETDTIVKIIKKQLENISPPTPNLTVEKLKQSGF